MRAEGHRQREGNGQMSMGQWCFTSCSIPSAPMYCLVCSMGFGVFSVEYLE